MWALHHNCILSSSNFARIGSLKKKKNKPLHCLGKCLPSAYISPGVFPGAGCCFSFLEIGCGFAENETIPQNPSTNPPTACGTSRHLDSQLPLQSRWTELIYRPTATCSQSRAIKCCYSLRGQHSSSANSFSPSFLSHIIPKPQVSGSLVNADLL